MSPRRRLGRRSGVIAAVTALGLVGGAGAYAAGLGFGASGLGSFSDTQVAIAKFPTAISGSPAPGTIDLGADAASTATLSGVTTTADQTITHGLYAEADTACATPVATATSKAAGPGTTTSGPVKPAAAGSYRWKVSYPGDARNEAAPGTCGNGGTLTVRAVSVLTLAFTSCTSNDTGLAITCPTPGPATIKIRKANQTPSGTWTARVTLINATTGLPVAHAGTSALLASVGRSTNGTSVTYTSGSALSIPVGQSQSANSFTFSNAGAANGDGSDVVTATSGDMTARANVSW